MSKPLYMIQSDLLSLLKRLENTDDILEYELLMGEIDKLEIDKTQKLEGCCAHVKHIRAEIEMIAGEIVRLKGRMEKAQKEESRFLDYLRMCLPLEQTFKSALHTISWRKSEAAEPVDMSQIPEKYLRMTWSPDRAKALRDMRAGEVVPGFELVNRNNLQVR